MKTKQIILMSIFWIFGATLTMQAQCLLWDTEHLQALKADPESPLYKNTVGGAYWFKDQMPDAVTRKEKSFSGDSHNYESLSIYTWPDPANPDGPWITRQGFTNPQYKEYDFERLLHLQSAIRLFGIAYYLTGEQVFHETMDLWMRTWFINPETMMYPQMEYTQVRPGENGNHGTPWGIIEAYSMVDILESYLLVNSIKPFNKDLNNKLHAWVKDFSNWMLTSEIGKAESQMENMHSVCYDVILYYFAAFNKDKKLMKDISTNFVSDRLEKQIDENGHMPFEMEGNRVFHDHLYNLQHIVDFCIMQKRMGKDFYAQNQQIIDRVFDFLIPYMKEPETFPYPQVSDWETDIADFKIELMRMYRLNSKYGRNRIGYEVDPFETEFTVVK